eukprot:gene15501-18412_t
MTRPIYLTRNYEILMFLLFACPSNTIHHLSVFAPTQLHSVVMTRGETGKVADPEYGAKYFNYVVALYSAGQFVSSPLFGMWGNKRPTREPVLISIIISIIGNIIYAICYLPADHHNFNAFVALMGLGRFIVGVGAGNVSVCRAFASERSDLSNKTQTMAKMSGAQGAGFVLGPAVGLLMVKVNFEIHGFRFDEYTSPGYISVLTSIFNIVLLVWKFNPMQEKKTFVETQPLLADDDDVVQKEIKPASNASGERLLPVLISIYLFAVVISIFAVFETILTPLTYKYYHWGTTPNGIILGSTGVLSVVVFVVISLPFIKKIDDRKTALFGLTCLVVALLFLSNYPGQTNLPKWQFFMGSIFVSIGYPIASSLIYAIFSKVLHPKQQGTKMGWLTAGGSIARMAGPLWCAPLWDIRGMVLFLTCAGLTTSAIIVLVFFYKTLSPNPEYVNNIPAITPPSKNTKSSLNHDDDA